MKFPSRRTSALVGGCYLLNNGVSEHVCVLLQPMCVSCPCRQPGQWYIFRSLFLLGWEGKYFPFLKQRTIVRSNGWLECTLNGGNIPKLHGAADY